MRERSWHVLRSAAALAVAGLACGWLAPAASAAGGGQAAVPRAPIWADRFVQGGFPAGIAASADEVFVTGDSAVHHHDAFATEAYSATTGARLWSARYQHGGSGRATAIATNPSGTAVFVTGSDSDPSGSATVSYDAATGARLWATPRSGPADGVEIPLSIAVSPDGSQVFTTGYTAGAGTGPVSVVTIAYDAQTGAQSWQRSDGTMAEGVSIAVSPDGHAVYVTGNGPGVSGGSDYVTIAYATASGARMWTARYNGPANGIDTPFAVAVSKDGSEVAVTGSSQSTRSRLDYATVAYRADDGSHLWARRYNGPANDDDIAVGLAFSSGGRLFVTGSSGRFNQSGYATIAYTAARGHRIWVRLFRTPGRLSTTAVGLAVAVSAGQVYVTGTADGARRGINTIAYNAVNGKGIWFSRYPQPGHSTARAVAIAVNQDHVFVEGHTGTGGGYITLAYPSP